jgi:soluble lytic murein transglycosylase-like protein
MQLMPVTAARYRVSDPFDPTENVAAGARYLKDLISRFQGDWKLALAAYNSGPGRVEANSFKVPPIPETELYIRQILNLVRRQPNDQSEP